MLPTFIHAGVPKAASATFEWLFKQHPEIYVPRAKETQFFSFDCNYAKGLGWYERTHYKETGNAKIAGDLSIGYSTGLGIRAPERIAHCLGIDVKLLFIFRHPVERAYSQYCMARYKGLFETKSFFDSIRSAMDIEFDYDYEAVNRIQNGSHYNNSRDLDIFRYCMYLYPGLYNSILNSYFKFFDRQNVLCLFIDDIRDNLQREANKVFDFLGVERMIVDSDLKRNESTSLSNPNMKKVANRVYQNRIAKLLYNKFLTNKAQGNLKRMLFSRNHVKNTNRPPIDGESAGILQEYYKDDIAQLSKTTGRDLRVWLERY